MAVHMVISVGGTPYRVTLSRDDAGNYVADAAPGPGGPETGSPALPVVRVVDAHKEGAMGALLDSLGRLTAQDPRAAR